MSAAPMPHDLIEALLNAYGVDYDSAGTVLLRPGQPLLVEIAVRDEQGRFIKVSEPGDACLVVKTEWVEFAYIAEDVAA